MDKRQRDIKAEREARWKRQERKDSLFLFLWSLFLLAYFGSAWVITRLICLALGAK